MRSPPHFLQAAVPADGRARGGCRPAWNLPILLLRNRTSTPTREAPIRTLGIGLIALAAIVASVSVARHRGGEQGFLEPEPGRAPAPAPAAPRVDLDAIRSAGL